MGLKFSSSSIFLLLFLFLLASFSSFVSSSSSADHRRGGGGGGPNGGQPPTTTPCGRSVSAQDLKRSYRLDSVKDDILRKLRMDAPPNVTGPDPSIPAVQTLLRQMTADNGRSRSQGQGQGQGRMTSPEADLPDHDHVSPDTFILLSQRIPPEKRVNVQNTCYFRFSPDLRAAQVLTAQLGIYIRSWNPSDQGGTPSSSSSGVHGRSAATLILIFVISRSSSSSSSASASASSSSSSSSSSSEPGRLERTLHRRRRMYFSPADMGKWYHFDVKALAENWMRSEANNLGIQILAQDLNGNPLAVLPTTSDESRNALRPYIEIQLAETRGTPPQGARVSRSAEAVAGDGSHCDETGSQRRCCRYPLRIDFDAFGWDWVIAPKQYEAYYCSGDCPFLYYQRDPHTHLYTQQSNASAGVPCCSPSLMSPLQLLYVDSRNSLILGTLPSMIVERCGCS